MCDMKEEILNIKSEILEIRKDNSEMRQIQEDNTVRLTKVEGMSDDIKSIKKIVEIWNDGVGFKHTVTRIGAIAKGGVKYSLYLIAIYALYDEAKTWLLRHLS